ncbi:MAG: CBS domain-containing protein [bacterium]
MSLFTAKTAMSKDIISIREDTPIREAMKILIHNNITGIPVVTEDMRLIGIVSEKDMLKPLLKDESYGGTLVSTIMTRDVVCFDENDELMDICESLVKYEFRRVPILSKGKLAGIITRRDVIKYILEGRIAVQTEKMSLVL